MADLVVVLDHGQTAPNGWELDGLLVQPPGDAGEGALPTVVLVHSGLYGRWSPGFNLGRSNRATGRSGWRWRGTRS
jgi:hypothetical protein